VEIAPRNPDVIVHTPSNVGENPVDVESWLPVGKPLRHKGFRGYPLSVEIALAVRTPPIWDGRGAEGGTSLRGAYRGQWGQVPESRDKGHTARRLGLPA